MDLQIELFDDVVLDVTGRTRSLVDQLVDDRVFRLVATLKAEKNVRLAFNSGWHKP